MKRCVKIVCVFTIVIVLASSFTACKKDTTNPNTEGCYIANSNIDNINSTTSEAARREKIDRDWYDEIIDGFKQDNITKSVTDSNAVAEYRVAFNIACYGYNYYSLQVLPDQTGKFTYMVHKSEDFKKGKMLVRKAKTLDANETQNLLNIIEANDFWNIPTIHPDEELGLDGTTTFIEGYENGKSHFIKMWMPDEKYGIYKIYKAFDDFAGSAF